MPSGLGRQSGLSFRVVAGTWLMDAGQILRYADTRREELVNRIETGMSGAGFSTPSGWELIASVIDTANLCEFLSRAKLSEAQTISIRELIVDELDFAHARA